MRNPVMLDAPDRYLFLCADTSDLFVCNELLLCQRPKQGILPAQRSVFLYEGGTPGKVMLDFCGHLWVSALWAAVSLRPEAGINGPLRDR